MKLVTPLRNALLDRLETFIGVSPLLRLRSGAVPSDPDAASTGTVVTSMVLPADWLADAASGAKVQLGTWQDLNADAGATVGHFELCTSGGGVMVRGTVTITGGGGELTLSAIDIVLNQAVAITGFNFTL